MLRSRTKRRLDRLERQTRELAGWVALVAGPVLGDDEVAAADSHQLTWTEQVVDIGTPKEHTVGAWALESRLPELVDEVPAG